MAELRAKGVHRRSAQDVLQNGQYSAVKSSVPSFTLSQEIVITDQSLFDELSPKAVFQVIQIMKSLAPNNPLWVRDKDTAHMRTVLAELRRADILRPLTTDGVYLVNPEKIRKGRPMGVLAALFMYCRDRYNADKHWRLSAMDVRRLRVPDSVRLLDDIPDSDLLSTQP